MSMIWSKKLNTIAYMKLLDLKEDLTFVRYSYHCSLMIQNQSLKFLQGVEDILLYHSIKFHKKWSCIRGQIIQIQSRMESTKKTSPSRKMKEFSISQGNGQEFFSFPRKYKSIHKISFQGSHSTRYQLSSEPAHHIKQACK